VTEKLPTDTERLDWWFSTIDKRAWINRYLQGVREGWSPARWRIEIDAAMEAEKP